MHFGYDVSAARDALLDYQLASTAMQRSAARALGLDAARLEALALLSRRGPLTPVQLADHLAMTSGGMTSLVQRLERDGFVVRAAHPTDGRSVTIQLTPSAARDIEQVLGALTARVERFLGLLSDDQRATTCAVLENLTAIHVTVGVSAPLPPDGESAHS
jgi:DNA-binding MarR family transcriptional regulator